VKFGWLRGWHWLVLGWALALVALAAVALFQPTRPAPFMVLHQPVKTPGSFRDYFGRLIPARPGWAWAWRVEQAVFGKRKPVNFYAQVLDLSELPGMWLTNSLSGSPTFATTNGLQLWFLSAERVKLLHEQLKQDAEAAVLSWPRISTAEGIESRLFSGGSIDLDGANYQFGLSVSCFARVGRQYTDLIACVTYLEPITNASAALGSAGVTNLISIQTNLDASFRLQVPKGNGFFLFNRAPPDPRGKRIGILVDPL